MTPDNIGGIILCSMVVALVLVYQFFKYLETRKGAQVKIAEARARQAEAERGKLELELAGRGAIETKAVELMQSRRKHDDTL